MPAAHLQQRSLAGARGGGACGRRGRGGQVQRAQRVGCGQGHMAQQYLRAQAYMFH